MSRRRNHYKPHDGEPLTEANWAVKAELEFATPVLCGRLNWGAATDKLEQVDCKACLRIIDETKARFERERLERQAAETRRVEAEAQLDAAFQKSAWATRVFRPRVGRA